MDWYLSVFRNNWAVGGIIAAVIFVAALAAFGNGLNLADWRNLALILGGVIALPLAIWRSGIAAKQVALIEAGLNTDRYQKGAAMLGDERLSVRQAGVFGLTELAENNFEAYHVLVMKLLCSFVRDRSVEQRRELADVGDAVPKIGEATYIVAADSQTAMNSLSALSNVADKKKCHLQRSMFDLNSAFLKGADLIEANLNGTHLIRANLVGGHLNGANLAGANLFGAELHGAHLDMANLTGARLRKANLKNADLSRTKLVLTNLVSTKLTGAQLNCADLTGADLTHADLTGADLGRANLTGAHLDGVIGLTSAQLETAENFSPDLLEKLREAEKEREAEAE